MTRKFTSSSCGPGLSPVQLVVLKCLLSGCTITAAAQEGGISRETVHRWLREDYQFRADFNRGRMELLEEVRLGLLISARKAAETVSAAIDQGDVKAALAVLRGLGGLSGQLPKVGSSDAEVLEQEAELEKREEESDLFDRTIRAGA